jgi:hypothetical protein
MELNSNPATLGAALLAFGGAAEARDDSGDTSSAYPKDNPELVARAQDQADGASQWREERQLEAATAPMDDTSTTGTD